MLLVLQAAVELLQASLAQTRLDVTHHLDRHKYPLPKYPLPYNIAIHNSNSPAALYLATSCSSSVSRSSTVPGLSWLGLNTTAYSSARHSSVRSCCVGCVLGVGVCWGRVCGCGKHGRNSKPWQQGILSVQAPVKGVMIAGGLGAVQRVVLMLVLNSPGRQKQAPCNPLAGPYSHTHTHATNAQPPTSLITLAPLPALLRVLSCHWV